MRSSFYNGAGILISFFVLVFVFSLAFNRYYPVQVIAGEASVGTWMSGVLLTICAAITLIIGMRQGALSWFAVTVFFFLLALDERFMFHEQVKERIIFSLHSPAAASPWLYELPVMAGACIGMYMVFILWTHMRGASRTMLLCAAVLGFLSIVFDILAAGVLWEECFKLLAELLMALALLRKSTL